MKLLLSVLILSTLISCDPEITYQFNVENKSDKELIFNYKHGYANAKDSFTICPPKTNCIIVSVTAFGSNPKDEGNNFLKILDTLKVKTNDSTQIIKNIYDRKNWNYTNEIYYLGIVKTGTSIYTIELENKDIEYHKK